ncbi:hypothetical protein LCGC14_1757060 [marine sediment metagenome]|uniref:Uncharacterized protein n=1 Tax=marine sediment metagenome TaxID=412755 RepID=A0A0F9HPF7_9ZZZZ
MDDGDKAIIREIAFEAATVIKESLIEHFATQLDLHSAQCPAKEAVGRWPKQMILLVAGVAIGSGSGVAWLLKLLKVF